MFQSPRAVCRAAPAAFLSLLPHPVMQVYIWAWTRLFRHAWQVGTVCKYSAGINQALTSKESHMGCSVAHGLSVSEMRNKTHRGSGGREGGESVGEDVQEAAPRLRAVGDRQLADAHSVLPLYRAVCAPQQLHAAVTCVELGGVVLGVYNVRPVCASPGCLLDIAVRRQGVFACG